MPAELFSFRSLNEQARKFMQENCWDAEGHPDLKGAFGDSAPSGEDDPALYFLNHAFPEGFSKKIEEKMRAILNDE